MGKGRSKSGSSWVEKHSTACCLPTLCLVLSFFLLLQPGPWGETLATGPEAVPTEYGISAGG